MHEASLVQALLRQVDALAAEQGGGRVTEIDVEVGPLSNVEPQLLTEAFDRLRGGVSAAARLVVAAVGLACRCRACRAEYVVAVAEFVCPACAARDVEVVAGDGVVLRSFSLEQSSSAVPQEAV